jgi:leader peptidase (prepilin peptidase) / N-methyltransferase
MTSILIFIIGLAIGISINYLADVLPVKRRFVPPFCQSCGAQQIAFNYFVWPRRCESCGRRRPLRTWVVELVFSVVAVWLWNSPPESFGFSVGLIVLAFLGLVAIIDLEHRLILHPVSLVGAMLGLVIGIWLNGIKNTLLGGFFGFAIMLALYYFGAFLMKWLARRRGQVLEEEALGFGDVILSGVIGLLLGWPGIVVGLILTILIAGIVSFIYLLFKVITRNYRFDMAVPYGPFLISTSILLLYFRETILHYLGW